MTSAAAKNSGGCPRLRPLGAQTGPEAGKGHGTGGTGPSRELTLRQKRPVRIVAGSGVIFASGADEVRGIGEDGRAVALRRVPQRRISTMKRTA